MGLNKPSRKEACPKTSRYQPAFRPMFAFRPAPMPTRRPCFARHLYSPGGHISTGAHVHLAPIPIRHPCFVRRPCSPDGHVSPNAHAHLVLMFRPTLKGDLGGAYRTRTSGTNPPWQESYSMHDFEAPDVKWSLCRQDSYAMYSEFPDCIRKCIHGARILPSLSRNAYISNEFCQESGNLNAFSKKRMHTTRFLPVRVLKRLQCSENEGFDGRRLAPK